MQRRKGFTLVELVVVIAVIAILLGVMIGTFASVINRANESAKMQEINAQKIEQKANDIIEKVNNSNWLGWEDFEASIVDKIVAEIANIKTPDVTVDSQAVQKAVSEAMAKYYAENAMGNTGLTEAQVKAIVENALGSFKYEGVSAEQVTTIVNTAVSKMTTGLTAAQVQKIVNAAADKVEAGQLTTAQITTIVANAVASSATTINTATATEVATAVDKVVDAINKAKSSQITAKEVERIVTSAITATGTTAWVTNETYATEDTFTLTSTEDVKGLATLVNGGYDFDDKTITLPPTVDLTNVDWTPIGNARGSEFKGTISGVSKDNPTVITGLTLTEQFNAIVNGYLINCSSTGYMDKVGVGFVAYLGKNATLENVTFKDVSIDLGISNIDGVYFDGISVGTAVGVLDGGTISNVKVESGSIKSVYRTAGLVGAAIKGTITNCTLGSDGAPITIESTGKDADGKDAKYFDKDEKAYKVVTDNGTGYCVAAGLIAYARDFANAKDATVTVSNCSVYATVTDLGEAENTMIAGYSSDCTVTFDECKFNGTAVDF